jgi:hypothetical protein
MGRDWSTVVSVYEICYGESMRLPLFELVASCTEVLTKHISVQFDRKRVSEPRNKGDRKRVRYNCKHEDHDGVEVLWRVKAQLTWSQLRAAALTSHLAKFQTIASDMY